MRYRLADLLDIPRLQSALDSLYVSSRIPSAIIDNDGIVHTGSGWQDVCTKFHRVHPEARKRCIESDLYISRHIDEANPSIIYKCPHGLVDSATPIVIEGEHIGNVFTGQLFLEEPDLDSFRAQARTYGFDEEEYIDAVKKVPVVSEQALKENLAFISHLTGMLAEMRLKRTREKEAEKALKTSEERFRDIADHAQEWIWEVDAQGKYTYSSQMVERILGFTPEEILQKHFHDLFHPDDRESLKAAALAVFTTKQPFLDFINRNVHRDGRTVWLVTSGLPLLDGTGNLLGYRGVDTDITERMRAEEQNRRSREELRMLACHLQENIEEERRRIAREIHDELGQQLTALKNDLLWTESHLPKGSRHLAGEIRSMSQLVDATTRSVHEIIHELRPPLLDDLGLPEAIDWQVSEFRGRTGIACELDAVLDDFDLDPDSVTGVFRLLQEMLANVAQHSGAKRCKVRIRRRADGVSLSVRDDGTGIPSDRIVDSGSFGLLGMRERVRALGGRFRIRGVPGKGTIVAVTIPVRATGSSPESGGGPQDAG